MFNFNAIVFFSIFRSVRKTNAQYVISISQNLTEKSTITGTCMRIVYNYENNQQDALYIYIYIYIYINLHIYVNFPSLLCNFNQS